MRSIAFTLIPIIQIVFLMVKQISLHAAGNAERSAYGSKYSNNHLQDSFPNFLFHFLFSFLFLMVQHLERD
ncbi:Uncharacterised protein [Segatella copri]|nr:Uncharacterised protein [Segatella copri]